jgi:hypothetical protein
VLPALKTLSVVETVWPVSLIGCRKNAVSDAM